MFTIKDDGDWMIMVAVICFLVGYAIGIPLGANL